MFIYAIQSICLGKAMFILILENNRINHVQSGNLQSKELLVQQDKADTLLKSLINNSALQGSSGDINLDGAFDRNDLLTLYNYFHDPLKYIELTDEQKKNADIDQDGKVTDRDFIDSYIKTGQQEFDTVRINHNLEGDFNSDGKKDEQDLRLLIDIENVKLGYIPDRTITDELKAAADINHDGFLNNDDVNALKSQIQPQELNGSNNRPPRPPDANALTGDVDGNGKVDYDDLERIGKSLNSADKKDKLIDVSLEIADINKNGQIDFGDLVNLEKILRNKVYDSLNSSSSLQGDLNNDGTVDKQDVYAMLLAKQFFFYEQNVRDRIKAADLNSDGKVDIKDLNILRYDILKESKLELKDFQNLATGPDDIFASQSPGPFNTSDDAGLINGDCGPTSLLMVARMFNKIGGGAKDVNEEIKLMRQLMGVNPSRFIGVLSSDLTNGAEALGLEAKNIQATIEDITKALQEGKKIIASVNPARYAPSPSGGHAIVITAVDGDNFTIYNPAFLKPMVLSSKELELAMSDFRNDVVIIGESNKTLDSLL